MFPTLRLLIFGRPCQVVVVHPSGHTAPCGRRTRNPQPVCTHHLALLS